MYFHTILLTFRVSIWHANAQNHEIPAMDPCGGGLFPLIPKSSVESLTPLQDSVRAKSIDRPTMFRDYNSSSNLSD